MEKIWNLLERWFKQKHEIMITRHSSIYFKEREIWWCYLGINVGSEQNGAQNNFVRPVLIIKKLNNECLIGLPLTTKVNKNSVKFHHALSDYAFLTVPKSFVKCTQIKMFSVKRLNKKMGKISQKDFYEIQEKSKALVFTNALSIRQSGNSDPS